MKFRNIQWNKVLPVLVLLFMVAYVFSPNLKSLLVRGLMKVGFFKPEIPTITTNGKYEAAPNVVLEDINNNTINLEDAKGKVVFINFWATWCPPCLAELPSVNSLYEKVKDNPNVVFLTVDIDRDLHKSTNFLQIHDYHFPVYSAVGADKLYNQGIPTTLVINKKGEIVFSHFNRANYDSDQFEKFLSDLAKQQ